MTMPLPALRTPLPRRPVPVPAARPVVPVAVERPAPTPEAELFLREGKTLVLDRDDILFYEGDHAHAVYHVVEGMLRIGQLLPDGRRHILGFLAPGDVAGLTLGEIHAHTAEAVTPTILSLIPRPRLDEAMAQRPALGRRLLTTMQANLAAAQEQLLLLGRKGALERLASFLVLLHQRQTRGGETTRIVHLPMGRGDIADYLGMTTETVSRSFTRLRNTGHIHLVDVYEVELLDPRRLADIAAGR